MARHPSADQHEGHAELEDLGHARRHLGAQQNQDGADDEERRRVPKTPEGTDQGRFVATALARDQRGDGREMIGLEGVTHSKQRPEARSLRELRELA